MDALVADRAILRVADAETMAGDFRFIRDADRPVLLLSAPFSLSADIPNNALMQEIGDEDRIVDLPKAMRQFAALYRHLAARSLVYLLPSAAGLQDQAYVANLGIVLHRAGDGGDAVVSRFRTSIRREETRTGKAFLDLLGYRTIVPPESFAGARVYFEGEADLKHIGDNRYVGAHGIRTSRSALRWLEHRFGIEIVPLRLADPRLFHLDTCVLPLTRGHMAVCTAAIERQTLRTLEKHAAIFDVTLDQAYYGINNCILLGDEVLCSSDLDTLPKAHPQYELERQKNERLEAICAELSLRPVYIDLMEFEKSGAALSCLVMQLNYANLGY